MKSVDFHSFLCWLILKDRLQFRFPFPTLIHLLFKIRTHSNYLATTSV